MPYLQILQFPKAPKFLRPGLGTETFHPRRPATPPGTGYLDHLSERPSGRLRLQSRSPSAGDVTFLRVVLQAGDLLFLPGDWFHQVESQLAGGHRISHGNCAPTQRTRAPKHARERARALIGSPPCEPIAFLRLNQACEPLAVGPSGAISQ